MRISSATGLVHLIILLAAAAGLRAETRVTLQPPLDTEWERSQAYDYLNELRQKAGMTKLLYNKRLERAAKAHAKYLIENGRIGHEERPGLPFFSGIKPSDRVLRAGYRTGMVVENVSSNSVDYRDSVEGLFSAIYHRFGFLDFQVDEVGISVLQNRKDLSKTVYVYDMGIYELERLCGQKSYVGAGTYAYKICEDPAFRIEAAAFRHALDANTASNAGVVVYPYDGQQDLPPAFFDELPDPLPGYRVSGFPISIQFNPRRYRHVRLLEFRLFEANGKEIEETKILDNLTDPNRLFKRFEYALFPLKRLKWGMRYRVQVRYRADGRTKERTWTFRTRTPDAEVVRLTKRKTRIEITPGVPKILYFEPRNPNDVLGDIRYPSRIALTFIDKNTIRIRLKEGDKKLYRLHAGGREVVLKVSD